MQIVRILAVTAALATALVARRADAALTAVPSFGANPGALAMYKYVPAGLTAGRPVVVVLHGCTQTAASMEVAGWNALADQHKFVVVYPEQQTANNPVRCFNWAGEYGDPANLVRGQGENQSIVSMVDSALAAHGGDPAKVYAVGFSAGAAMTAVLAATWPDRFAAVSIMAGLPYRCATSVNGAYSCQSPGVSKTAPVWGDLVRGSRSGPYPRVQIWQGTSDTTVVPMNQGELVKQWTNAHGADATADATETLGGTTHAEYRLGTTVVVDTYSVSTMGHAIAFGTDAAGACPTTAAQYFSNKGVCATLRAAVFFGLTTAGGGGGTPPPDTTDTTAPTLAFLTPADGDEVSGAVTIVVAASDDVAVDGVTLSVDGAEVGTAADAPYQFAWDASAAGAHTLVAVARDVSGNQATTTITVTVPGVDGGGGSGSGDGSNGATDDGPGALPGCALDAGGGHGGPGALGLALGLAVIVRRRRRR